MTNAPTLIDHYRALPEGNRFTFYADKVLEGHSPSEVREALCQIQQDAQKAALTKEAR